MNEFIKVKVLEVGKDYLRVSDMEYGGTKIYTIRMKPESKAEDIYESMELMVGVNEHGEVDHNNVWRRPNWETKSERKVDTSDAPYDPKDEYV